MIVELTILPAKIVNLHAIAKSVKPVKNPFLLFSKMRKLSLLPTSSLWDENTIKVELF